MMFADISDLGEVFGAPGSTTLVVKQGGLHVYDD